MDKKIPDISSIMRELTTGDFLAFGVDRISYIRPARINSREAWSICAANGEQLSVHLTEHAAMAASRQRELQPVRVH